MDNISIRGARTHNLKNIDVDLPRNKFVVITGLSGSGKSSLAFDTLYAEGQRRYAESLSAYARQFMDVLDKPDVDSITGLSPSIAIEQHKASPGSRSSVATITEIGDYLRLLFARAGIPYCPEHDVALQRSGIHDMVDAAVELPEGSKLMILAPLVNREERSIGELARKLAQEGYVRMRVDGNVVMTDEVAVPLASCECAEHVCEVVVDRLKANASARGRLAESFETATRLSGGVARLLQLQEGTCQDFSLNYGCPVCGYSVAELSPSAFSYNNALGACPSCQGSGFIECFDPAIIVRDGAVSLSQGAVCGWSPRNSLNYSELRVLGAQEGFSLDVPFDELSEQIRTLILYGSEAARKLGWQGQSEFKGVITKLDHQWAHARSETTKVGMRMLRNRCVCSECGGKRYRKEVHSVYIGVPEDRINIIELTALPISTLCERLRSLQFDAQREQIARGPLDEILRRLGFLVDVGLGYLTLGREARTLSGGELQRIRLAGQIGSGLVGVTYILDEPTIGLHQRDNDKLIATMRHLAEAGNSVIVVEHDEDVIRSADYLIDMGPGAGELGGFVVAAGTPAEVMRVPASRTGAYLSGKARIEIEREPLENPLDCALTVRGATGHNLKNLTCSFPVGAISVVTGVSGSGKSTLVNDTLAARLRRELNRSKDIALPCESIEGIEYFDKVIDVDQSPIGKTPRSNPASYTGVLTLIRDVFAQTPAARERGYDAGRFSFNTPGGRCEACEGDGQLKIEMGFLPPVYVTCSTCMGKRFNRETLEVKYRGKSIADVLDMTVAEALEFFSAWPLIVRKLQTLLDVGLGYIRLGQSATTFSGGEAQRIKLAEELSRRDTGRTLYILDEPTTGLHFEDVAALMKVLRRLTILGNTVIVIEHNIDVIRLADWIVDIGPDGGTQGGELVVQGTPERVAATPESLTGHYLAKAMIQAESFLPKQDEDALATEVIAV